MSGLFLIVPIVLIFLATSCFVGICWAVARWRSGPPFTHHSYRLPPNGSPLTDAEAAEFADLTARFWSKDPKTRFWSKGLKARFWSKDTR